MANLLWIASLLLAIAAFPRWQYSREWGYLPTAGLALLVLIVLALHLLYVI